MRTWQLLKNNPYLFQRYFIKEYLLKGCRKFFEERNYHEFESPILTSALPQERYLDVLDVKVEIKQGRVKHKDTIYIIPTTETFNKKMLAAGLGEHFVITKVARGTEEIDVNHSSEFTMLEWYHLNTNYFGLMQDCEELFIYLNRYIYKSLEEEKNLNRFMINIDSLDSSGKTIKYQDQIIDLTPPWDRISIPDALEKICNVSLKEIQTEENIKILAIKKGYSIDDTDDWQTIFELILANEIEPTFSKSKPTFVYNYPRLLCPLTKINIENPLVCEKVELYLGGKEIANGYTELLDWSEQEKRFLEENEARKRMRMKDVKIDFDLINAIRSGIPNVSGIGMGLDRVAMILADAKNIAEINYFPASEWFN